MLKAMKNFTGNGTTFFHKSFQHQKNHSICIFRDLATEYISTLFQYSLLVLGVDFNVFLLLFLRLCLVFRAVKSNLSSFESC